MGGSILVGGSAALYLLRRRFLNRPQIWQDPFFKKENLALYSTEAELRGQLLRDVNYRLVLRLNEQIEDGYLGNLKASFDLTKEPKQSDPLFLDF